MEITKMLLDINPYSRPHIMRDKTTKVAVHYVGNPGTSALANRNYFNNLAKNHSRYVSSNYIIGIDGEVIECVPPDEIAYCTNQANTYSVSIECCHPDETGKFTAATETSLAELCAYLLDRYHLTADDIIRHYDVTGKQCPLYWSPTKYQSAEVANARFKAFKDRVRGMMGGKPASGEFKVRVIDDALNIRKEPGTNSEVVGVIRGGGVYTIVDTQMVGSVRWGRLKSGAGWISLGSKYVRVEV